jgi:Cysteine rich repeat
LRAAFTKERIMVRTFCLAIVLAASSGAAFAQGGPPHSAAEERACSGDAHRLCKNVLHDEFQVASCLQEHRDHVSRGCRAVMEHH